MQALHLNGTVLGDYPLRVLPSKTAIVPVNTQYLPKTTTEREKCSRTVYAANIDKKVDRESVKLFFETICGKACQGCCLHGRLWLQHILQMAMQHLRIVQQRLMYLQLAVVKPFLEDILMMKKPLISTPRLSLQVLEGAEGIKMREPSFMQEHDT